jgi:lupus La protein
MADAVTETKPVEAANPPAAEVTSVKTDASDANVETEPTNEPATEEQPAAETAKQGEPASDQAKEGDAAVENEAAEDDSKPSIFRPPPGMLRVSGRNQHKKFVKSDPASLPETDDPREIRKQVRSPWHDYTATLWDYADYSS